MKRILILLTVGLLLLGLIACGGSEDSVTVDPNAVAADYGALYFSYGGCDFGIYDEAEPVLEALGDPSGTFEADSCAYQGKDYYYYFSGFELMVNDVDGTQRITGIIVTDDTVSNPQGVKIGMAIAEVPALMDMEYNEANGVYDFVSGSTLLRIKADDSGFVTAIEYTAAP